jgi:hypothetical protein
MNWAGPEQAGYYEGRQEVTQGAAAASLWNSEEKIEVSSGCDSHSVAFRWVRV